MPLSCSISSIFQSTLPCGSDKYQPWSNNSSTDFNPRSLAGATCILAFCSIGCGISIHAPLRERQRHLQNEPQCAFISIHAPLRERLSTELFTQNIINFNPRSLAGATEHLAKKAVARIFQSTLPCGSDISHSSAKVWSASISIHAPLRERLPGFKELPTNSDFNPRSLAGATQSPHDNHE